MLHSFFYLSSSNLYPLWDFLYPYKTLFIPDCVNPNCSIASNLLLKIISSLVCTLIHLRGLPLNGCLIIGVLGPFGRSFL